MANIIKIKRDVELLIKQYLMDELPQAASSSSPDSLESTSDGGYTWLTGMTEDEFKLPAIVVICREATLDILSYNWDCQVDVEIIHHYADTTRAEHNNKSAEIRDKLIAESTDICEILKENELGIYPLLYTPTNSVREVRDKKYVTTQSLTLNCNYLG